MIPKAQKIEEVDYWGAFKLAVNQLKIAPSEFWQMSVSELLVLLPESEAQSIDITALVNANRKRNGATKRFLAG